MFNSNNDKHQKFLLSFASLSAAVAIAMGAFGAHWLKERISESNLEVFQTGVHYHLIHSIAIILVVILLKQLSNKEAKEFLNYSAKFFIYGILLFAGSLYLLSTKAINGLDSFWLLGPMTPLGGLFFILGWVAMFLAARKK